MSNYMPVVKLSSFGRGYDSDMSNVRYISRFDTLMDESGNHIPRQERERLEAVQQRLDLCPNQDKTSFRVIVSLPSENTERARQEALEEIRNRYSSFLCAFHATNDKGKEQPHLHVLIFNDQKNHPLKDRNEIFDLRNAIGERFKAAGISFPSPNAQELKPKFKQSEIHMKERGQKVWLDDIRNAVSFSLSEAISFDSFQSLLKNKGISIIRETKNSITFQNSEGMKARLDRLFTRMKSRADILAEIAKNQKKEDGKMDTKREDLLRAERSFVSRLNNHMEDMLKNGIPQHEVQSRIENILKHRTESEDTQERWTALKQQQEELKSEKQNWYEEKQKLRQQQYEQQRAEREQEYQQRQQVQALQRVLSSGNPIAAFAATLVFIVSEMLKKYGDINRDGVVETKEQELLKMREKEIIESFRDTLNPPQTLKKPEPSLSVGHNRMSPGR
jgi:hypothetical protein